MGHLPIDCLLLVLEVAMSFHGISISNTVTHDIAIRNTNYNESLALKIPVITAQIKSSQSSLTVAW
jgi:hypothetical protein